MAEIAIIGTSALFPGSRNMQEFWEDLVNERDLTGHANEDDFGVDPYQFFTPEKGVEDKCYSLRGGFIRDLDFDPTGFELPAEYLAKQDKLYQWSLYAAKEALRDGGYIQDKAILASCGLIMGNLSFPTTSSHKLLAELYAGTTELAIQQLLNDPKFKIEPHKKLDPQSEVLDHTLSEMVRIGLGLQDNHYTLDAACASSLYAIKLACDELITGRSDMMLAGAISASDQLFIHIGFSIFHAYAKNDQKFAPFDKNSAGLVSSEGAGMVLLKRLDDAERDGDKILGVISGIGLSNDGRGKFLLSPNPKGQRAAFERAYSGSSASPTNTSYIECHATGTTLGDITELNSIAGFFGDHNTTPLLGSVKSNMGHLLTAAGMSGLLKVLLAMQKGIIPPNINLTDPIAPANNWNGAANMVLKATPWAGEKKQAGINSFGFGGTNAHMVVRDHASELGATKTAKREVELLPMAIIGMDVHFGSCHDLEEFHSTIYFGKQLFKELPMGRWKGFEENHELLKRYGFEDGWAPRGAYIDAFEIDLLRFKIQPKEAEGLHPQQALLLKVADAAIKDSDLEEGQNVAVLVAMESELALHQIIARWDVEWQVHEALERSGIKLDQAQEKELIQLCKSGLNHREGVLVPSEFTSYIGNLMASRIAALWDFSGAAFTISCGEDSVSKALQIAQNLLSVGDVDAVVVGAVDMSGGLENVLLRNKKDRINSAKDPSLSFNVQDHGWLVGEGAGAVVLKRKKDCDQKKIYSFIDKIEKNHSLQDVGYLELSATGIKAQDQTEITTLLSDKTNGPIALGSVKANIGHTQAASGMAALIKTALCVHHRFIPGIPNWAYPKDDSFKGTSFYFPEGSRPWTLTKGQTERRAAINSGNGTRIGLSSAEYANMTTSTFIHRHAPKLFILISDGSDGFEQRLSWLSEQIHSEVDLDQISHQLHQERSADQASCCIVLIAENREQLATEIKFFQQNISAAVNKEHTLKTPRGSHFAPVPLGRTGKVAFVYPGSATAYAGLGQDLFQLFPQLMSHYEERLDDMAQFIGSDYLFPKLQSALEAGPDIHGDAIAMMSSGVFFSVNFTRLMRHMLKVEPDIAFGYSMGECSSMWYALGMWHPDGAKVFQSSPVFRERFAGDLKLLAEHWNISIEEAKRTWGSLVLLAPRKAVEALVEQEEKVYLTFVNSENEVIISGDRARIEAIAEKLKCPMIHVPFQNIIHQEFCKKENEALLEMHHFELMDKPDIKFYSSIDQKPISLNSYEVAKNSAAVCSQMVDFPRTVGAVHEAGARIFMELGANATCTNWINSILSEKEHLAVSIDQKGRSTAHSLMAMIAQLISHGVDMDLSILYPEKTRSKEQRQFMKTLIPGGRPFMSLFEDEQLKVRFSSVKDRTHQTQAEELVLEGAMESSGGRYSRIRSITSPPTHYSSPTELITDISMNDKNEHKNEDTLVMEQRTGENGLRLYDFEAGEQFEGKQVILSQQDLEEFATGKIAKVFGDEYAVIDTYHRRVMLPMYPYLLVSRVTAMNAKLGEFKPSTMTTEYDIPYNAWFSTDEQIPSAVCVESGQCDLLLISYLGIDLKNKGNLVYRLLDCTLTFMDDLPYEGQILRYDISINSFVNNGDNLLFFFSYNCFVEDRLVLKMDGGCAGFFADDQLEVGAGVVYSKSESEARNKAQKQHFTPLLQTKKTSFSKADLKHLIEGNIERCFDDISYFPNGRNASLRIPPEKILMLDRITTVNLKGGAYGLGYIEAEKDLHPGDWYFPCHFRDDEVLAGSLQAEGGGNLLRFFMLMLGLQRLTKDARFQPITGIPQKVRCRKQVTPKDTKLIYKLEIKEIGLFPYPYVIGDLEIISDDVITVHFADLGLQLRERSEPKYLEKSTSVAVAARSQGALMNELDITTFALGDMADCFGPDFSVYAGRKKSRQPNTDLQLISRVIKVEGTRGELSKPSTIYAEYDVPKNVWYYVQNSNNTLPYSILMEIALQPCGLLGAYLGSTLQFKDQDLFLRNLDGDGTTTELPIGTDFRGKTIANKCVLVSSIAHGGTVLQRYTFELSIDGQVFYKGNSSFGFFSAEALAAQAGLDKGVHLPAWYLTEGISSQEFMQIKLDSLFGKMKLFKAPVDKPHYKLASDQLDLLDHLIIAKDKGLFGKGYVHATRSIHPFDWFFTCHFYEDPVMPGSLGVEAIIQAMQIFCLQQDLGKNFKSPKFVQLADHKTVWKYRGQIMVTVEEMHLEAHIKTVEMRNGILVLIADAYLWNGTMRIYQVTDLALGIAEVD